MIGSDAGLFTDPHGFAGEPHRFGPSGAAHHIGARSLPADHRNRSGEPAAAELSGNAQSRMNPPAQALGGAAAHGLQKNEDFDLGTFECLA
jgi:hypothetical protein